MTQLFKKTKLTTPISYSVSTWLRHMFIMLIALFLIVILLTKNYEHATLNLVSSLNEEFSFHADEMSQEVQDSIISSSMQLFYSPSVTKLRTSADISNFEGILGIRTLNAGMVSSDFIHSIYVYNSDKDFIYTTYEMGSFYSHEFFDNSATNMLKNPYAYNRLTPIPRNIVWSDDEEPDRVYSFLVHENENNGSYNSMIINVFADEYNNTFFNTSSKSNNLMLLTARGALIASSPNYPDAYKENDIQQLSRTDLTGLSNGYFINNSRGEDTIYHYTYMPESEWYLVKITPYNTLLVGFKSMLHYAIIILLVILITGVLVAYISMRRFYGPLKRIISTLSPEECETAEISNQLMVNFDSFIANQKEATDNYHHLVKIEFLKHLLLSTSSPTTQLAKRFDQYNIQFIEGIPYHMIYIADTIATDYSKELDLLDLIHYEMIHITDHTIIIYQSHSQTDDQAICSILYELNHCLCLYSQPLHDIRELRKSYIRLGELKLLHLFHTEMTIMSENWLLSLCKDNIYQDILETNLLASLKNDTAQKAILIYHQFIDHCKNYRYSVILFNLKRLYITLDSYYLSLTEEEATRTSIPDLDTLEKQIKIANKQSDIDQMFISYINEIIDLRQEQQEAYEENISTTAKSFIDENYTDYNLTLSYIASTLDIPSAKLSKSFKNTYQVSINDYINQLRIQRSKELLTSTDLTIKEITKQIGIENTQYFYTLFKNNTKLTPSSYRQLSHYEDQEINL